MSQFAPFLTVPEIIDPVFAKTSQNARFLYSENERFGLVFVKTGSINSGTGLRAEYFSPLCSPIVPSLFSYFPFSFPLLKHSRLQPVNLSQPCLGGAPGPTLPYEDGVIAPYEGVVTKGGGGERGHISSHLKLNKLKNYLGSDKKIFFYLYMFKY